MLNLRCIQEICLEGIDYMKLLLLSAANNIHTVRWANALFLRGYDVYVVSCKNHREGCNKFLDGIKIFYLKYKSGFAGIGYYLNKNSFNKIIKLVGPDIINVHYASGYGTLARISRLEKYLLNVWGSDIYDFPEKSIINKIIIKKNLSTATYIASTSNCMANVIKKYTKKDVFITPFGVNVDLFKPIDCKNNHGKFVFCTVKTLLPTYNIEGIIIAFDLFIKRIKKDPRFSKNEIVYEIYGDGKNKSSILKLIDELNLTNYVFLKGYVPNTELPKIINSCDVFLLNSVSESFGVAAVEAMSCGKPVIASDVDGFKEVIEDGVSGVIVDRNEVEDYANAMYKLFKDENLRKKIGVNARQRVVDLFNWEDNVNKMISYYEVVIDAAKKS